MLEESSNKMRNLIQELQKKGSSVVLYGASDAGRCYADILCTYHIPVNCFIDDDSQKQGNIFCGIQVKSLDEFVRSRGGNEIILIASYGPSKIIHKIKQVYPFLSENILWSDFYLWENGLDYMQYYTENMGRICKVNELLQDEKSRQVLKNVLNYKISRNPQLLEMICDGAQEQYFSSSIMNFTDREVFLDLGAYTGDTICSFCRVVDNRYKSIIAVEPDKANYKQLISNTKELDKIEYYQAGIAEKDGLARFKAQAVLTSRFDNEGEEEISTRSVDSIMGGRNTTFMKADIEGAEKEMLRGAEDTIKKFKPKLAIAVYHKKDDIFNIPLLIHSYREDYRFFLRHYTDMPIDTVLYAI